jgi:hypothetical protein
MCALSPEEGMCPGHWYAERPRGPGWIGPRGSRRKVNNRRRPVFVEQLVDERTIADITIHEDVIGIAFKQCQVTRVSSISQQIQIDYSSLVLRNPMQNKVRSNKSGPAGNNDVHRLILRIQGYVLLSKCDIANADNSSVERARPQARSIYPTHPVEPAD